MRDLSMGNSVGHPFGGSEGWVSSIVSRRPTNSVPFTRRHPESDEGSLHFDSTHVGPCQSRRSDRVIIRPLSAL